MKKLLLFAALFALGTNTFAQGENDMMQKWMEYATPGKMQKMLAKQNGVWEANTKFWMAPGQDPMESTAEVTTDMYMGDRFQKSTYSGDMMGMPFKGESTTGYDNVRKVFVNTWIDNTGTGIMYSEGTWNEATKTIEYKGNMTDAMAGKAMPFREVVTIIDDNNYKMEMFNTMEGKEMKTMEVTFKRK